MAEAGNEELTADEVETLRLELERRTTELGAQLASNAEAAKPVQLDQTAVGRVSRVDALQGQALAKATRHAMQQQLAQCKAALQAVARDFRNRRYVTAATLRKAIEPGAKVPKRIEIFHNLTQFLLQ